MSQVSKESHDAPEDTSEEDLYLQQHEHHLDTVVTHATRLLKDAHSSEERAGVLHDLLEELYRHEDRLQHLREEGLLSGTLRQQPSLVPVSIFIKVYLADPAPSLSHSCRALQPFAGRAACSPVFSYVVERLGLLHDPPPDHDRLALHLRNIHAIFRGPPGAEAGPLGAHHARLMQRYAECLSRQRYRVRLEESEPLRLASRVFQWLEECYSAALNDLRDDRLALSVVKEAHAVLLATPYLHKDYLDDVVRRAMAFLATSLRHLPAVSQPMPAPPPQAPEPLMAAIGQFFPSEFFSSSGSRLLAREKPPSVVLQNYLWFVSVMAQVFDVPDEEPVVPRAHVDALLSALKAQDDCGLLVCLQVMLRHLKRDTEPEVVRGLCQTLRSEAISGVKAAWAREVSHERLDEEQPILRVTAFVREIALLSDLHTSPFPEEAVQEAYEQVHAAFVRYLQRVAARHKDPHRRYFILLKNLLVLGTYEEVEQYLDLHAHTPDVP